MTKVSVILPNYNHSAFLTQRIESILSQTFQDFELIILDDCSPDNSREIIERYRQHHLVSQIVYNAQNSGSTFKQWEKGISLAQGEYIWLAESDDYCDPTFLSELVSVLDSNSNIGIAYCQSFSVDQNNTPLNSWIKQTELFTPNIWKHDFVINGKVAIINLLIYRNIIPNASAVVFRKTTYYQSSGINTKMKLNGDWLLWTKLLEVSDLAFVSKELNYFRQHTNKATGFNTKNYNGLKEQIELYSYIENTIGINAFQKKTMTYLALKRWLFQFLTGNPVLFFKNFSKIQKAFSAFDSHFYYRIPYLIGDLLFQRAIMWRRINPINISKVKMSQIKT